MRALYGVAGSVPLARVLREYRRWLWPLGVIIGLNLGVLAGVVLPLRRSVDGGERRAAASGQALTAATIEFRRAEALRSGQAQATIDLDRFYRQVLPADAATARRIASLNLTQLARMHRVAFDRSVASPEPVPESQLERLKVSYAFSGAWNDIRRFIYDIETGAPFVIIDNVILSEGAEAAAPLSLTLELSTYYRGASHDR